MTGGTGLFDLRQQGIAVTIGKHGDQLLIMTGGLAFSPERIAAARKIDHLPGFQRLFQCFAVHPREHQQLPAVRTLGGDRHQSLRIEAQGGEYLAPAASAGRGGFQHGEEVIRHGQFGEVYGICRYYNKIRL